MIRFIKWLVKVIIEFFERRRKMDYFITLNEKSIDAIGEAVEKPITVIEGLKEDIANLEEVIAGKDERIAELERMLGDSYRVVKFEVVTNTVMNDSTFRVYPLNRVNNDPESQYYNTFTTNVFSANANGFIGYALCKASDTEVRVRVGVTNNVTAANTTDSYLSNMTFTGFNTYGKYLEFKLTNLDADVHMIQPLNVTFTS